MARIPGRRQEASPDFLRAPKDRAASPSQNAVTIPEKIVAVADFCVNKTTAYGVEYSTTFTRGRRGWRHGPIFKGKAPYFDNETNNILARTGTLSALAEIS